MAASKGLTPRRPLCDLITSLLLTLLASCLFFEILRLHTFASATPITRLERRGETLITIDLSKAVSPNGNNAMVKRDVGDDIQNTFSDAWDKVKDVFKPSDDKMTAVEVVSEYAYDELNHEVPLEKLKKGFEKRYGKYEHGDNKTDDYDWIHDQIRNVIPGLKEAYERGNETDSGAGKHLARSADADWRLKPGQPGYYTSPGFFPHPMPSTPVIHDSFKTSLEFVYKEWQTKVAADNGPNCEAGLETCNDADGITVNHDPTPMDQRKQKVESCIQSLVKSPDCFAEYQSAKFLKPYLAELVDQGKVQDKDGKIKNFYRREIPVGTRDLSPLELEKALWPTIANDSMETLASTWNKSRDNIANGWKPDCPATRNPCDDARQGTNSKEKITLCILFLGKAPTCLERYKHDKSIAPYLNQLADAGKLKDPEGKINVVIPEALVLSPAKDLFKRKHDPYIKPDLSMQEKNHLGKAYKDWVEGGSIRATSECKNKVNACEQASITCKKGNIDTCKPYIETCIEFLYHNPKCMWTYKNGLFIHPYLVDIEKAGAINLHPDRDKGTRSAATVAQNIRERGVPVSSDKLVIGQAFKDELAGAYNQWKEDIANQQQPYCPSKKRNACDAAKTGRYDERQHYLEMCIAYLHLEPGCLERYQDNGFLKPHLEDLSAEGKITGYSGKR